MIVKKVPTSRRAAPKSKALNVRALADSSPRPGQAVIGRRSSIEAP